MILLIFVVILIVAVISDYKSENPVNFKRVIALFLDFFIVMFISIFIYLQFAEPVNGSGLMYMSPFFLAAINISLIPLPLFIVVPSTMFYVLIGLGCYLTYVILLENLFGATFGKVIMGLEIKDYKGENRTFKAILIRNLIKCITGIFITKAFFNNESRGIHDKVANTIVVNRKDKIDYYKLRSVINYIKTLFYY